MILLYLILRRSLSSQDEARYEDERMLKNNLLVCVDGQSQKPESSSNDLVINMDHCEGRATSSPMAATPLQVIEESASSRLFVEAEPLALVKPKIRKRGTATVQSFQLKVSVKKNLAILMQF